MDSKIVTCPHCGRKNRLPAAAEGVPRCGNCHQPLPWVVDAGDDDFTEVAERAGVLVLVDMWAAWCGPCRQVSPALEQVAKESGGEFFAAPDAEGLSRVYEELGSRLGTSKEDREITDVFAALAAGLNTGLGDVELLRLAAAAAALNVTRHGLASGHLQAIQQLVDIVDVSPLDV